MPEINLIITHEVGLHARPASLFVQTAAKFLSVIEITHQNKTVNAKSILAVLTLGVHKDGEIILKAEGPDQVEALKALEALVLNDFREER